VAKKVLNAPDKPRRNGAGAAREVLVADIIIKNAPDPVFVSDLFLAQLDDQELAVLKNALDKVTVDCTFG